MTRFKSFFYTAAWLVSGALLIIVGADTWNHKFVKITPKLSRIPYIASPESHQFTYYAHSLGLIFFGAVMVLAALYMIFFVLFSRTPTSEKIINNINAHNPTAHSPKISGWLAFLVIATFIGVLIYAAIRT